jgi:hypothetical protein
MCLEYFRDKRILALWFSGFFGANALMRFMMLLLGIELTLPGIGITLTTEINAISFLISSLLCVALGQWACKRLVRRRRLLRIFG